MRDIKAEIYEVMFRKTHYYNDYSKRMYKTMHFENHRVAHLHHLVDVRMLLNNRGIHLPIPDIHNIKPFIEAILVDTLPIRFAVENKKKMVEEHARKFGINKNYALTLYINLIGILSDRVGLSTLVFTGWFNNTNGSEYHIVISEMI